VSLRPEELKKFDRGRNHRSFRALSSIVEVNRWLPVSTADWAMRNRGEFPRNYPIPGHD
jgi:hypothetical protein